MAQDLASGFLRASERFPDRPALELGSTQLSYRELRVRAAAIADAIVQHDGNRGSLAAVFAHQSISAYSGILGILGAGRGYVPLQPRFPSARTLRMLNAAGTRVVVVGAEAVPVLGDVLRGVAIDDMLIIGPELADFGALGRQFPHHRFVSAGDLSTGSVWPADRTVDHGAVAYLLFTSGTTGAPKGVAVRHRNVAAYLDDALARFPVQPGDRASQAFDLTFDLSVHDLFATWSRGACLVPVPSDAQLAPAQFIRDRRLSLWFSVPSVAALLARLRLLRPGAFPSLRRSLFCGEALPARIAELWAAAAPNSTVDNLYGPTEATIAISSYHWRGADSAAECRNGLVPIGRIHAAQRGVVVDGELYLSGSQVTGGYWGAETETGRCFVRLPDTGDRLWYRTGDLVEADEAGCLHFKGRVDRQVKIGGHRVELAEIDAALRDASASDLAVAVPWPVTEAGVEGLVGCIAAECSLSDQEILMRCGAQLPAHMVPRAIVRIDAMPLNDNGKIDHVRLLEQVAAVQSRREPG